MPFINDRRAPVSKWIRPSPSDVAAARQAPAPADHRAFCIEAGRLAVRSLYDELTLYPKPGLVSLIDNGSHTDMNAETFLRSLFALRHYFIHITRAGMHRKSFPELKRLGMEAEARMLLATQGINTHRGAIFCLGLLSAAIGYCHAHRISLTVHAIRAVLLMEWGEALAAHTQVADTSTHGLQMAALHAASGAREEAALGFPSVFEIALPVLRATLLRNGSWEQARVDAFFALMAHVSDTNVYYRGGADGASLVKARAQEFISLGGTAHPEWIQHALESHQLFVSKRLSPGGAADLLAATCLVHKATRRLPRL